MAEKAPAPRIIFNTDGGAMTLYRYPVPIEPSQCVRVISELEETAVDVVCVCVGDALENYFLDPRYEYIDTYQPLEAWVGEPGPAGETLVAAIRQGWENLESLRERGIDHFALQVEESHRIGKRCFASFRMNDGHEDDELRIWMNRTKFKQANPHLLIGGPNHFRNANYHCNYSWGFNYALPEVQGLMLEAIDLACERYDIDGIELDYDKVPRVFKQSEAIRNTPILTEFMRRVRARVREWSARKEKGLTLMARVPGTLGGALSEGFDHEAWIAEELVDILAPMSASYLNSENEVNAHVELARNRDVLIYGALELGTYKHSPCNRLELLGAVAANALSDGADGTYLFNYDCHRQRGGDSGSDTYTGAERLGLLELHDAEALAHRDKLYFVTPDTGWIPCGDFGRQLPRMIGCVGRGSNESQACTLRIGEDLAAARSERRLQKLELRVLLEDAEGCQERLFCLINGQRFEYAAFEKLDAGIPAENHQGSFAADFRVLSDPPLVRGDNRICFLLDGVEAPNPGRSGCAARWL